MPEPASIALPTPRDDHWRCALDLFSAIDWAAVEDHAKAATQEAIPRLDDFLHYVADLPDSALRHLQDAQDAENARRARDLDTRRRSAHTHIALAYRGMPILVRHIDSVREALFHMPAWGARDVATVVGAAHLLSAEQRRSLLPPVLAVWRLVGLPVRRFMGDIPYDY